MRDEEKRWTAYKEGLTDGEIAARCGVSPDAIGYWRRKRGLPPNKLPNKSRVTCFGNGVKFTAALNAEQSPECVYSCSAY
ncbi:MAG: hypothetical protein QXI12_13580 [Candidatus Methanomethyliaceae archaeon]